MTTVHGGPVLERAIGQKSAVSSFYHRQSDQVTLPRFPKYIVQRSVEIAVDD